MSRPEPLFQVGERVMVRSPNPQYNTDDTVIVEAVYGMTAMITTGEVSERWRYQTANVVGLKFEQGGKVMFVEQSLCKRPDHRKGSWDEMADIWQPENNKVNA